LGMREILVGQMNPLPHLGSPDRYRPTTSKFDI
jgi:hypothetical protein